MIEPGIYVAQPLDKGRVSPRQALKASPHGTFAWVHEFKLLQVTSSALSREAVRSARGRKPVRRSQPAGKRVHFLQKENGFSFSLHAEDSKSGTLQVDNELGGW